MNTTDYLLETGSPADVAVIDAGHRYSYAELGDSAARLAAALGDLGLPRGSRVGILGANSLFWVAAYLAVMKLDLVAVPFSEKATLEDVRRSADLVGCAAVFADRRCGRRFAAAVDHLPVLTDEIMALGGDRYWPESSTDPDSDAVLMFTSGTTGTPRAVRLTHSNIQANTASIVSYLGLRRSDRVLVILPFFYCFGASLLHTHLRMGAGVALCNSFTYPETAIDMLEEHRCTVFAGVPSSFQLLLRATSFAARELPALRIIQQAGGKLSPVLIDELQRAAPQAQLFVMYGQTEATARLSYLPPDMIDRKAGSIGKGIPGVQLRVLDDDKRPVAVGQTGEIYASGASISPGYYGDIPGSTAKFSEHGLRTGDLAVVDDDGYIFIVDRKDDFIKSWGYRVSSQDVEAAALQSPEVVSAAAIGQPDPAAGEAITLFVTIRPGSDVDADDVLAVCRRHLAKHMVPQSVHILADMPMNASGKIAKTALRQRFQQTLSTP